MTTNWVVGLEQTKPYEFVQIEVFEEEGDAIAFAETFMNGRAGHRRSKRRWTVLTDQDGPQPTLIVFCRD